MNFLLQIFWERLFTFSPTIFKDRILEKFQRAHFLINIFYFYIFLFAVQSFSSFTDPLRNWSILITSKELFSPIWSVQWMEHLDWEMAVRSMYIFFFIASLLGLFFWKKSRLVRLLVFSGLFFYISFLASFGKINHYFHLLLITSFIIIFLPQKNKIDTTLEYEISFLKIFWGTQFFILLTYFSSGFFKIAGIISQEMRGELSALSSTAMAQNFGKAAFGSGKEFFFGEFLVNHPHWFFALAMILGYLVEFLSVFIPFLPKLHRLWGVFLILLHSIILMTIGADFTSQIVVVGIFILFSPFDLKENYFSLPKKDLA
ncbi:MAG: hypothetical protein AB8H03_14585 [Saprospiraceae bacterium]